MNLSKNSWYYKLCQTTYGKEFKSLCTLFWASLIATIFYVPIIIFCLPFQGINYLIRREFNNDRFFWGRLTWATGCYLLMGWIYTMFAMFWRLDIKDDPINCFGFFGWAILLISVSLLLMDTINIRIKKRKIKNGYISTTGEKQPNIAVEYIKAVKKKVCPIIKWN